MDGLTNNILFQHPILFLVVVGVLLVALLIGDRMAERGGGE